MAPNLNICAVMSGQIYLSQAVVAEVEASAPVSPFSLHRKPRTRLSALLQAAHPGKYAAEAGVQKEKRTKFGSGWKQVTWEVLK